MNVKLDYEGALSGIQQDVSKMLNTAEKDVIPALKHIGGAVAMQVENVAKRSNREFYYSNGKKKPNTHIQDDVVYNVKKSRKSKQNYVSISGGKKTWQKWHLVSDGHVAKNGRFVPGDKFVDKAAKNSEQDVDNIIDMYIRGILR